jgi:hypothetical protein
MYPLRVGWCLRRVRILVEAAAHRTQAGDLLRLGMGRLDLGDCRVQLHQLLGGKAVAASELVEVGTF